LAGSSHFSAMLRSRLFRLLPICSATAQILGIISPRWSERVCVSVKSLVRIATILPSMKKC